jgi:ABC-type multidrug transport system fused ATPase/permease subunit
MGIDSDFAKLIAEGQDVPELTRDRQVAVLLTHARHTSRHLSLMAEALDEIRETTKQMAEMVRAHQVELAANTSITAGVRDTMVAGRIATKIIKWVGAIAIAFASLYGAWATFLQGAGGGHGGGGIGP